MSAKFACVCCGYKTLDQEGGTGSYDICAVCSWEDDGLQFREPEMDGGANQNSLVEARKLFPELGTSDKDCAGSCRKPTAEESSAGRDLVQLNLPSTDAKPSSEKEADGTPTTTAASAA